MKEWSWFACVLPVITLALGVFIGNFIGKRNDSESVEQGRCQRRYNRTCDKLRDRQRNIGRRIYNALLRGVVRELFAKSLSIYRTEDTPDGLYRVLVSCVGSESLRFTFNGESYSGYPLFQIEVDTIGSEPIEVVYFPDPPSAEEQLGSVHARLANDDQTVEKLITDLCSQYFGGGN